MVMGPTHAMSGAAAWLTGSAIAASFGVEQTAAELAVGTIACAGAALFPDIDCAGKVTTNKGGSTVARAFGPASMIVAEGAERVAYWFYLLTKTKKDRKRKNGHRTLTHTLMFSVLMGILTGWLAARFGKPAVIAILFVLTGLAVRGLMATTVKKKGWIVTTLASVACAYGMFHLLEPGRSYWVLGLAMGVGCVIHIFGDMITKQGSPLLFPVPFNGKVWHNLGLPRAVALRAGGKRETRYVMPALTVVVVLGWLWHLPEVQQMVTGA
ncbi:metal-dependent hydrolase [Salininema proteolyticum]|uniref:Metal-dependent hydrolase n=1 Tax=Salininema proteolyticum TaxID=1607685 RepID=A0ABV8TYQ3_9ACTN